MLAKCVVYNSLIIKKLVTIQTQTKGKHSVNSVENRHCEESRFTGVTNDLQRRVYEHKLKLAGGFTKKYNIIKLVYYEVFGDIESAITREKQIKGGHRRKKGDLINSINKEWKDLYEDLNE